MADRTTDFNIGVGGYNNPESAGQSRAIIIEDTEVTCLGSWISIVTAPYGRQFNHADGDYPVDGLQVSHKVTGNNTRSAKVAKGDVIQNITLTGVAVADERDHKPVFFAAADVENDGALAYMVGGKPLAYVHKYKTTNIADIMAYPMPYERDSKEMELAVANFPAPGAFFGLRTFDYDVIIRGIFYIPTVLVDVNVDIKAVVNGNVFADLLLWRAADTVNEYKEKLLTDHADCFLAKGQEFKFELDADAGAATGQMLVGVLYDRIPKCPIYGRTAL